MDESKFIHSVNYFTKPIFCVLLMVGFRFSQIECIHALEENKFILDSFIIIFLEVNG